MKIEITQGFFGRPDETADDNTEFLAGAVVDAPDAFARMAIAKGLAKPVSAPAPAKETKPNETK